MTHDALERFRYTKGWKVGVDGSVTLVTIGAGGSLDSNRIEVDLDSSSMPRD